MSLTIPKSLYLIFLSTETYNEPAGKHQAYEKRGEKETINEEQKKEITEKSRAFSCVGPSPPRVNKSRLIQNHAVLQGEKYQRKHRYCGSVIIS